MELHIFQHGGSTKADFFCHICKCMFYGDVLDIQAHHRYHFNIKYECATSVCEICHKKIKLKNVEAHKKMHNGEKKYKCAICNCRYSTLGGLKSHMQSRHQTDKSYYCNDCKLFFKLKKELEDHSCQPHFDRLMSSVQLKDRSYLENQDQGYLRNNIKVDKITSPVALCEIKMSPNEENFDEIQACVTERTPERSDEIAEIELRQAIANIPKETIIETVQIDDENISEKVNVVQEAKPDILKLEKMTPDEMQQKVSVLLQRMLIAMNAIETYGFGKRLFADVLDDVVVDNGFKSIRERFDLSYEQQLRRNVHRFLKIVLSPEQKNEFAAEGKTMEDIIEILTTYECISKY